MGAKILLTTLLVIWTNYVVLSEKNVICYYGTWATYRWGNGKFDVEDINPDLCSHLVYSFVGINNQGTVVSLDSYLDLPDNWGRDNFGKFNALKQKSPKLKTLLAVGGWNEGSGKYSVMAADPNLRKNFINSALNMILTHGFDGFDLDWEYPNRRDTVNGQADINNFSQLVKELKEEFDKHGLLLTAAVSSVGEMAALSYDVATISKYLDIIGLMTYDFYGAWDPVTGHNAALHKGEGDENADRQILYTVDVAVEYWLAQGCPPEKLVIGLPFYGRTFTLASASNSGVRAPSSGEGIAGPFTASAGSIGYNEFCDILRTETWDVRYDDSAKVPYAVQDRNWVSYDDPASLTKKIEYGLSKNVSGIMLWSIETDDFRGICSGEYFPLLRAINKALGRNINGDNDEEEETERPATDATTEGATTGAVTTEGSTTAAVTTEASTTGAVTTEAATTTTVPPDTEAPIITVTSAPEVTENPTAAPEIEPTTEIQQTLCAREGIVANPDDCSTFLMCVRDANGGFSIAVFNCPPGLYWDAASLYCNYADLVNCNVQLL